MLRNAPRELWIAIRATLVLAALCGLVYPLVMTGIAQLAFPAQADGSLIRSSSGTVVGSSLIGECFYQPNPQRSGYLLTTPFRTGTAPQRSGEVFFAVDPRYFQGRPSYVQTTSAAPAVSLTARELAGDGGAAVVPLDPPCASSSSRGSNLAPSNPYLIQRIDSYAAYLHCLGVDAKVTFSGSQLAAVARDPARYCSGAVSSTTPVPVDLVTGDFTSFDPDISQAAAVAQVGMVAKARGVQPSRLVRLVDAHVTGRSLGVLGEPYVDVLELNLALNEELGSPSPLPSPAG